MNFIDLRSDTVTQPTAEMREAMANAVVGDDVYGEDPTINRLQEMSAELMGKEAGLFVPSGTMGNLVAILSHCQRGDEVILGDLAHTFLYEGGGMAALGGIQPHTIRNQPDGTLLLEDIRTAIRSDDIHQPTTRMITIENTHNRCGGTPLTIAYTRSVAGIAREHGLRLHIDGARIFNAAIALNVKPSDLVETADSVTFCLSKGLSAPVGSVLCGDEKFIRKAQRIRKQLGGGMRQAGIIAAAGIVALEKVLPRLPEDHRRAHLLADGLKHVEGIHLEPHTPQTNMVYIVLDEYVSEDAYAITKRLMEKGVKVGPVGKRRFRLVLHYWITDPDVEKTVMAF
ncbi:MAG: low-specificity L-threonine aldolase, partial [Anaerolineales bacterium]|nr:low-specificity L-threonine aldolase [Anaerolineales bacterium]